MDDTILKAEIDSETTLYVSPIATATYQEHISEDNLGGDAGYFLMRARKVGPKETFEILAKAPSFDAAGELFDMIVSAGRRRATA